MTNEDYLEANRIDNLLKTRGQDYGQAWLLAGKVWKLYHEVVIDPVTNLRLTDIISESGFAHNWMIIQSKLARAMTTPFLEENWRDIEGYAKLVADYIVLLDKGEVNVSDNKDV